MLRASYPSNPPVTDLRNAADAASTCVPVESWIYPAFDHLAAEGELAMELPRLDGARNREFHLEQVDQWLSPHRALAFPGVARTKP